MRIHLDHPELATELRDLLRGAGCICAQVGPQLLEVVVPDAPNEPQARREVRAYLAGWSLARPGAQVELLED